MNRALLVLHSPVDNTVGIDNAAQIYQAARHPNSFISLDTADHMLSRPADTEYAGSVIAGVAARYIGSHEKVAAAPPPAEHQVVTRIGKDRYRTEITAGGHSLVADEPVDAGGRDTGPTPYDLVVGLGACTAMNHAHVCRPQAVAPGGRHGDPLPSEGPCQRLRILYN